MIAIEGRLAMRKISYNPLWKKLIDLKMTKTELQREAGFSRSTLAKMGKDEYIALEVVEKICNTLHCDISEVISLLPEDQAPTTMGRVTDSHVGDDPAQDSRRQRSAPRVRAEDTAAVDRRLRQRER